MSVLIKGMKMPETCGKCKLNFLTDDYVCCSITDRIPKIVGKYANSKIDLDYRLKSIESVKRPDWCPLIEVKDPHGDLIDRDILEQELSNGIKAGNFEEGYEHYANINSMDDCVECVRYADTVIEAEEE